MPDGVVEAAESFSVQLSDGTPLNVSAGDRYYGDDPIVRGREHLFRDLQVRSSIGRTTTSERPVEHLETAAAAPGERRRGPGRPPKDRSGE